MSSEHRSEHRREYVTRVVMIRRTVSVVKGARQRNYIALVVVGDGRGSAGFGFGKSAREPQAVQKAVNAAERRMQKLLTTDGTVRRTVIGRFGTTSVKLVPSEATTGIVAPDAVREIAEAVGIKYVRAVCQGPNSERNLVEATFRAMLQLTQGHDEQKPNIGKGAVKHWVKQWRSRQSTSLRKYGSFGISRDFASRADKVIAESVLNESLFVASAAETTVFAEPDPSVMRPIVWIEGHAIAEKLIVNSAYVLHLKMSDRKAPSLAIGGEISQDEIPTEGLPSNWVIVSNSVELSSPNADVQVKPGDPSSRQPWVAKFALHIPQRNESAVRSLHIVPLSADEALLEVFVYTEANMLNEFRRCELIRQFEIVLGL